MPCPFCQGVHEAVETVIGSILPCPDAPTDRIYVFDLRGAKPLGVIDLDTDRKGKGSVLA